MKRVLSWFVLLITCFIVLLVVHFSYIGTLYLIDFFWHNNLFVKILLFAFLGSTVFGWFCAVIFYGATLSFFASEAVYPSKKGTRYLVYSVVMLVLYLICMLIEFDTRQIIMSIFYVVLLIISQSEIKETGNK